MKTKKNITKIIFIFLCLFSFINTDDACTCTVDSEHFSCASSGATGCLCKFKYPNSCQLCNDIDDPDDYYSIEGGVCSNLCLGNKIIESTKECTSENIVHSLYQLGDVFYINDPSSTEIECDSSSKKCKCKNYYYITDKDGKKIYNCVNTVPTGYSYLNSKTSEFLKNECPEGLKVTKSIEIGGITITRCSDSC